MCLLMSTKRAGIAQSTYRRATSWTARVRFPAGARYFSLLRSVQPTLGPIQPTRGPIQPTVQWLPGAPSLEVKRPGCEADHSPPFTAEIKNYGAIPSLAHTSLWRVA
jgi:hypothetical protein